MDSDNYSRKRLSALALIAALAFFYNAELFLPVTAGSMTYNVMRLFGTLAVCSVLLIPAFSKIPSYFAFPVWGLAFLLAVPQFTGEYALHNMFSSVSLVYASMVAGITIITGWYARKLDDYSGDKRRFVDTMSVLPLLENELDDIKYEITRARRYKRPVSVVMIQPVKKSYDSIKTESFISILHRTFRRTERLYDMGKDNRLLIFCPETTNSSAEMLVNRIRIMVHREQNILFNYGIATFPDQELTFEGLVTAARGNLEASTKPKTAAIKPVKGGKLVANRIS